MTGETGAAASAAGTVSDGATALLAELAAAVGGGMTAAASFYARASDRMRGALGGEAHFARAFTNDRFAPLAYGSDARLTDIQQLGDSVRATLVIETETGTVAYVVAVAKARFGDRAGTWCLSGVAREGIDL